MFTKQFFARPLAWAMILLLAAPPVVLTQQEKAAPVFKQEELDQIVAPIALYPDALVAQILMASTFPLEVVQADRFAKQNASLKGEALTKALESQNWDPSVKSLVNFSQVLTMMSEKLDWTQKLGDAFLAQQKPVMDTIQSLRAKAQAAGNLKTTKEQTVIVEQKIIKIEPASPQVIYVPTYNPTVVYGAWPYPAYPPYSYYPPGYVATTAAFSFAAGVAMGAAWGYAWGNTNWNGGSVNINNSQNININNNINRQNYNSQTVQQRYNQATPSQQVQARQAYRGYTGSALTPAEQQQAQARAQTAQQQQTGQQAQQARQQQTTQQGEQQQKAQQAQQARGGEQARTSEASGDRGGASQFGGGGGSGSRGGAFEGIDRGGSSARSTSQRGSASRASSGGGGGGRSGGGGGGRSGGGRR
jgi:hypothetical protein